MMADMTSRNRLNSHATDMQSQSTEIVILSSY
jgi:hypothetical protein